ncbi:hypothetical protein PC116_g4568 [Phytophthora cactorum]|uniref:Uncharacterized protein n=1 Tax=Phytophthora cactorum TaxID=29920 RepID=A0A8T1DLW6_9STRA|nr:hypothetical protein Pcac1_g21459 [Phytophthora cactorum]KAG2921261.1 hypothetical protein PC114_g5769 [Phytophthora cactorum]KAG2941330.1 hypothetical protein PC117_g10259 [Phytophthora cactorum]KAG3034065.1 hypothetical protein PC119_g5093 [Phytophthora cactorum]KAG3188252.1 hypothetical protein C6341_g2822 [Phytophthora cactorum]
MGFLVSGGGRQMVEGLVTQVSDVACAAVGASQPAVDVFLVDKN